MPTLSAVLRLLLAYAIASVVSATAVLAQGSKSEMIQSQCDNIGRSHNDASVMIKSVEGVEISNVYDIAQSAWHAETVCLSIVDLLRMLQFVNPSRMPIANAYVGARIRFYAGRLQPDIDYLTKLGVVTRIPGLARLAGSVHDQVYELKALALSSAP